ncbi:MULTISPECIES: AAA family ATPase [Pseudomonas]|uniref:ATPase AAA-type core domain-containing protein n=1 Tax=Pseudomonas putida NBRC 14164 TaxID=1211579 RepID=A0ABN5UNM6_PSEPU|nr:MULTISPECIES: ATP-binding protein [Pseudomonas]EKT4459904.1 AAA family ATPase [Pseudomonas putida]EKT4558439.1 AAA family ATPase [Pseudomonas putida]MCX9134989.1 ATP-binding protein [Pseudomonas sp. DCB_PUT]MDD1971477.1 ATP-binding protein [Pseudomonas putida]MDO1463494.1 ATP-binding protein [Pseudomonas putida]
MLKNLTFEGVGPAERLAIDFKPRLNFLTGDNGLGKSFVLDIAWWSLTRTWPRDGLATPRKGASQSSIAYCYEGSTGEFAYKSSFDHESQQWSVKQSRPAIPGVVIYAGVDGSFSVWDPARNYWKGDRGEPAAPNRPRSFDFSPDAVWNGLLSSDGKTQLCNGLISDWVLWQEGSKPAFDDLVKVLEALSPSGVEKMKPGEPMRVGDSVRDIPSLRMPYGQDVPLTQASAGMRRIAALAYLLVWTWREHQLAYERYRVQPAREIIFLIDEIECHLHPEWQRRIVPALLNVMNALTGSREVPVQLLAATHSPLVLASVEPDFDGSRDCIWDFDLVGTEVQASLYPYSRKGDVNAWLSSDVFNLKEPSSVAAEEALGRARTFLREVSLQKVPLTAEQRSTLSDIDSALRNSLSDVDSFWVRWSNFREQRLGNA